MQLIAKGKVKEVYAAGPEELEFLFTDSISVFDKVIPSRVKHKGEVLCRVSAFWFKRLENLGINTHFKQIIPPNKMRVKRVRVIRDYGLITEETKIISYLLNACSGGITLAHYIKAC